MAKRVDLTRCPSCDEPMKLARGLTQTEYDKCFDPESPQAMPANADSASPDQRAELGDLYRCRDCGYQARVKADEPAAATK